MNTEVLKAIKDKREELRLLQGEHANKELALVCFKELVALYACLNISNELIEKLDQLERKAS